MAGGEKFYKVICYETGHLVAYVDGSDWPDLRLWHMKYRLGRELFLLLSCAPKYRGFVKGIFIDSLPLSTVNDSRREKREVLEEIAHGMMVDEFEERENIVTFTRCNACRYVGLLNCESSLFARINPSKMCLQCEAVFIAQNKVQRPPIVRSTNNQ